MRRRYEGVLFDLGGTLFEHLPVSDTDSNLLAVLDARHSGRFNAPDALATYRRSRHASEQALLGRAFYLHKQIVLGAFADLLQELGLPPDDIAGNDFYERQRTSVVSRLMLRRETLAVLESLRERGCYLGIVSNIDDDYFLPLLERTRLRSYLRHCLSSESAGSCKPDAAIFKKAIAVSELTASDLLYVGDSPLHDVEGARGVGMATAWLASGAPEGADKVAGATADYRIESLSELVDIVAGQ